MPLWTDIHQYYYEEYKLRIVENKRHFHLKQTEKSAIAERTAATGHRVEFKQTQVLFSTAHYYVPLCRKKRCYTLTTIGCWFS